MLTHADIAYGIAAWIAGLVALALQWSGLL
jgi:hypothetical protein